MSPPSAPHLLPPASCMCEDISLPLDESHASMPYVNFLTEAVARSLLPHALSPCLSSRARTFAICLLLRDRRRKCECWYRPCVGS